MFSKTIVFTKFLRKKCEREFLQFPHSTLCVRYIDITNPLRNYEEKHLPTNCLRPKYSQRKIYELLALIKLLFPKQERNVKTFLSKILLFTLIGAICDALTQPSKARQVKNKPKFPRFPKLGWVRLACAQFPTRRARACERLFVFK